jgi:hypothetical protein
MRESVSSMCASVCARRQATVSGSGAACLPGYESPGCADAAGAPIGQDVIRGYIDQVRKGARACAHACPRACVALLLCI